MESANLNTDPSRDAQLEAWLHRASTPIADDGFSARVMAALPPRRVGSSPWVFRSIAAAGASAGLVIVLFRSGGGVGLGAIGSVLDNVAATAGSIEFGFGLAVALATAVLAEALAQD
jgi:flavin-dependent dehydrogenase